MSVYDATSPGYAGNDRHASGAWPAEKDEMLMRARQQGLNWGPIANQFFPDKSANACRKRHERLMEKRNSADSWDGVKLDELAKAYMEVRERMWTILADRVNEKWSTVEAKCMEKGVRNLLTVGRTASRKERQQYGGSGLEYDEALASNHHPSRRYHSKSQQDEGDDHFNDSAIGPETDQTFSAHNPPEHQRSYPSSNHEQAPYSAEAVTPPYNPGRSYSLSSSNGYSNVINHSFQQPSPYQQNQTLPSFSSAFGQPMALSRHSPNQNTAVTTH